MQGKTDIERKHLAWLAARRDAMVAMIGELVNTDGGSYDKAGVDAVGAKIRAFLEKNGIACETIPVATHGDGIRATVSGGGGGNRPVLLLGHRDTVFPKGEPTRRPFRIENGRAYGPGVVDMKAGLVMNAFLLVAFKELGGAPSPVVGLFTGDEEIGSPTSRPIIENEARRARVVFNSEPGRPTGNVVTGRKAGVFFRCEIEGKAAHSGGNFKEGISAIEELARKIIAWHKMTDLDAGTTLNVGLVSGGQSVNTVAPNATCDVDLRYVKLGERDRIVNAVMEIGRNTTLAGTKSTIVIRGEFLPLNATPESEAVFKAYQATAGELGMKVEGEFSGGCADSGFTAAVGTPTLCAVGPVGGRAHSPEEYLEVDTIVPRAQALALTILRLAS